MECITGGGAIGWTIRPSHCRRPNQISRWSCKITRANIEGNLHPPCVRQVTMGTYFIAQVWGKRRETQEQFDDELLGLHLIHRCHWRHQVPCTENWSPAWTCWILTKHWLLYTGSYCRKYVLEYGHYHLSQVSCIELIAKMCMAWILNLK